MRYVNGKAEDLKIAYIGGRFPRMGLGADE